jgi:hypothetical protein
MRLIATDLVATPLPGSPFQAGPTFEYTPINR